MQSVHASRNITELLIIECMACIAALPCKSGVLLRSSGSFHVTVSFHWRTVAYRVCGQCTLLTMQIGIDKALTNTCRTERGDSGLCMH